MQVHHTYNVGDHHADILMFAGEMPCLMHSRGRFNSSSAYSRSIIWSYGGGGGGCKRLQQHHLWRIQFGELPIRYMRFCWQSPGRWKTGKENSENSSVSGDCSQNTIYYYIYYFGLCHRFYYREQCVSAVSLSLDLDRPDSQIIPSQVRETGVCSGSLNLFPHTPANLFFLKIMWRFLLESPRVYGILWERGLCNRLWYQEGTCVWRGGFCGCWRRRPRITLP